MSYGYGNFRVFAFGSAALLSTMMFAAHTDAPPGRYDYTAKVAAAGAAGEVSKNRGNGPEQALALADRTFAYVAKALGEASLVDEKAELEADRKWLADAKTDRERSTVEKEIRRLRRRILFRHPDLQFDKIIAVQRGIPYSRENHMVDQYLGRWSRPGPGLVTLENWRTAPKKKSLLGDRLPVGTVMNPDLHWNADRLIFSFCDHTAAPPADAQALKVPEVVVRDDAWVKKVDPTHPVYGPGFAKGGERAVAHRRYFIYECAADGSWVRQLTGCAGDPMETQGGRQTALIEDADPCYLPDGGFVFTSTRGQNYGRCHWGRYVPSFLLYRADLPRVGENSSALNIRQLSFGEANEWEPAVMNDGRIAYTRWDYINRHAVWFQSLWATRPDGTAVSHVYGNYSEDIGVVTETKAIPGSRLLLCTASAHHNITSGSLFLLDPAVDEDGLKPVTRVTPEVPFPESEGWNTPGAYCSPFPINDTLFLCSYSDETLGYPDYHPRHRREDYMAAWPGPNAFGIWLVDTLGGRELVYADPEISTFNPIPLVKRPCPPALVSSLPDSKTAPDEGICYVENVYDCRTELPKGAIAKIRINKLDVMGACRRETLNQHDDLDLHKETLGAVPVSADGSCTFKIPAGVPIQLQAVDTNGVAVFTMRSFIYAQKGEVQGCTGCHENKFKSGAPKYADAKPGSRTPLAPQPEVDVGYDGPFSFTKSIQPIFDRHCIGCHGLADGKGRDGKPVTAFSLIGTNGIFNLIQRKQISFVASYRETRESKAYDYFAAASPLWKKLKRGHGSKAFTTADWQTLGLWMDLNVTEFTVGGGYSWNRPESREIDVEGEKALRAAVRRKLGPYIAEQPFDALVNRGMEERSRVLWLAKRSDYESLLSLVKASLKPQPAQDVLGTCGRDDACQCNSCWVRRGRYNAPKAANGKAK